MTDSPREAAARHARGAFFTPEPIAAHLTAWALGGRSDATVLDPTCGEAVFLRAAGREMKRQDPSSHGLGDRLYGVDLHHESIRVANEILSCDGLNAQLLVDDFFAVPPPNQLGSPIPYVDAVVGNPPFVRYQLHSGDARKRSVSAALAQGVRLNGLASSWAALLVHASSFLKPDGRLAMVLPAELLTVGYAEPVRRWLRGRFERVSLVLFEKLQFQDALENVVLLLAEGSGGCETFSLYYVDDAESLGRIQPYGNWPVTPQDEGKWTDLLLPMRQRQLFRQAAYKNFVDLSSFGQPELGAVTGANKFFTMTEATRLQYGLTEKQVVRISPPGTKHFHGLSFGVADWNTLRESQERVWLFSPNPEDDSAAIKKYMELGYSEGVDQAYKCQVRAHWWRSPTGSIPDLFFTYMSHRYPRLIHNAAKTYFLNSMHGIRLREGIDKEAASALPLLCLNSVTMLGAEVYGRSYGGGILKMEPSEAARLPVPAPTILKKAWSEIRPLRSTLDRKLRAGLWVEVVKRVDAAVLSSAAGLKDEESAELLQAAQFLRKRRLKQGN